MLRANACAVSTARSSNAQLGAPLQPVGQPQQDVQVAFDATGDLGPLHLHRDLPAVVEDRPVHLRDRRRAHRVGVEHREPGGRVTQVGGHDLLDRGGRGRRDVFLQPPQLRGELG